jgi:hypothetical protein
LQLQENGSGVFLEGKQRFLEEYHLFEEGAGGGGLYNNQITQFAGYKRGQDA